MEQSMDPQAFRRAMGMFATGVTVLATEVEGNIHGMTANAFSSLSLDPPLILVCLNRGTKMEGLLKHRAKFSVNMLSRDQEALSRHFAGGHGNQHTPEFRFTAFAGVPQLEGCLCTVACEVYDVLEGGDHVIVLGRVFGLDTASGETEPLLFWKGKYHALQSPVASA
ncbi:MAG: flavin reductase family protein [Alicyclobacillus macrosporangiidus]|uniref:flavin reductase family protein n=1 Tax=Alicyclobacillus macrosporangiidus TaxID=392015 RepID=UPI0026EA373A|nr:flavin reductase family protein [Alicyclobacillus macrosporangiidus]MCL6599718.1 flavin reductase family protein [Alicyclobacillus macrosporangiidus]